MSPPNCLSLSQHRTINKHNSEPSISLLYDRDIKYDLATLRKLLGRNEKSVMSGREKMTEYIKHYLNYNLLLFFSEGFGFGCK